MIALTPGQVVDPSHAALFFVTNTTGYALPAFSLSYSILDPGGTAVVSNVVVDLVNDIMTDAQGNPLDLMAPLAGYYAARWTVPSNATLGKWSIVWTYVFTTPTSDTLTATSSEAPPSGTCTKYFEVLATAPPPFARRYAFVTDLREELGCGEDVSDARLYRLSVLASAMIDRITGRFFTPAYGTKRMAGASARSLLFGDVIIAISSLGIDTEPTQQGDLVVELDLFRVYNRHLSQGMLDPDDRENPKLEFVHSDDLYGIRFIPFRGISLRSLAFPIGVQNIHARGFFGFTDPDGSPWGETPAMLQHACKLIVARELPKMSEHDARTDAQQRWRVIMEKTRDIQNQLADPRKWGGWFGDPELDMLLASYVRPPRLGSA